MTKAKLCAVLQKPINTNTISRNTAKWVEQADGIEVGKGTRRIRWAEWAR